MNAKRILLMFLLGYWPVSALAALGISQSPLFVASTEPRIMLLLSRDEQLSIKAYTDYTDLDNDGVLDTSYKDSISYYGYFDSNKCYAYSSSKAYFSPSAAVTSGTHQCNGSAWSGNFLNWASMTRMDIVRKVLYGGDRVASLDTTGANGVTVLERQFLPNDVHSFVKVYTPPATPTTAMPSIQSLTGISGQTSISLCNVSSSYDSTINAKATGLMTTLPDPLIKVASGSWPQWAASEVTECELSGTGGITNNTTTQPSSLLGSAYTAKVKVCDTTGGTEANCKTYTNTGTNVQTVKPIGLLQKYSDLDAIKRSRFGLMTGSYTKNKSGGILRKNIALIAGTGTSTDYEIDQNTGAFTNQNSTGHGIVYTLDRLRIAGFNFTSTGTNGKYTVGCNTNGIAASAIEGKCFDWGNPLSETYLETIRYFAGLTPTTAFNFSDSSVLAGMPTSAISWTDPLPSGEWCALCNIVVLSTGINSFDMDQLTNFTPTGGSSVSGAALTTTVGILEGINGSYMVGKNGTSTADLLCSGKNISDLALVTGICPDQPGTEGGFGIAGLAYATKTVDLRPGYSSLRQSRWGGVNGANADWAARQPMTTFAVQLAQAMPTFTTAVGTAGNVTILPACQANSTSGATSTSPGWRNCGLLDVIVDPNVAMSSVGSDHTAKTSTCSGNGTTSQCFSVVWEDSQWGNDHDMDGIERLGYCVGSACTTFKMLCPTTGSAYATIGAFSDPGIGKVIVAACVIQTSAGDSLQFGYTIAGTVNDGVYFPILRPGGKDFYIGSPLPSSTITAPTSTVGTDHTTPTEKFTQGNSVGLLKNPLWYVAKYGGFTESAPTVETPTPGLQSEWDANGDGTPDNYFDVRNPANLVTALGSIFDTASRSDFSAASEAANSTSLRTQGRVYQAKFSNADWSGHLLSYKISVTGALEPTAEWDAGIKINAQDPTTGRVIITKGSTDGVAFSWQI
jgi:type IV pilus assembly protein PilY1